MVDQNCVNRYCQNQVCCCSVAPHPGCGPVASFFCGIAYGVRRICEQCTICVVTRLFSKLFECFAILLVIGVLVWYMTTSLLQPYDFTIIQKRLRETWV